MEAPGPHLCAAAGSTCCPRLRAQARADPDHRRHRHAWPGLRAHLRPSRPALRAHRRADLDITDEASIAAALDRFKPWAIINTAGFVRVDEAEQQADECFRINVTGPELLGKACKLHGIPLVTFSSDLVFDGQLGRSYVEPDEPAPACEYGRSKAEAEARLLAIDSDALIVRTSAFFGPWDRYNFLYNTVAALRRGEEVIASDKTIVSPTYVPDLVHATLDLLLDEEKGVWHLTNQGAISWHELACEVADRARLDRAQLRAGRRCRRRRHQPRQQARPAAAAARPGARRFHRPRRDTRLATSDQVVRRHPAWPSALRQHFLSSAHARSRLIRRSANLSTTWREPGTGLRFRDCRR